MASRKNKRKVDTPDKPPRALTDWAEALQSVVEAVDEVPEGFHTIPELAEKLHISLSTVRRKVYQLQKEGKVEMKFK